MEYIFLAVAVLISIHGYTFARWVGGDGNKVGMFGVLFLIVINLSLCIYRLINVS